MIEIKDVDKWLAVTHQFDWEDAFLASVDYRTPTRIDLNRGVYSAPGASPDIELVFVSASPEADRLSIYLHEVKTLHLSFQAELEPSLEFSRDAVDLFFTRGLFPTRAHSIYVTVSSADKEIEGNRHN